MADSVIFRNGGGRCYLGFCITWKILSGIVLGSISICMPGFVQIKLDEQYPNAEPK